MLRSLGILVWFLTCVGVASAQVERVWLTHKSADHSRVVVNWETAQPGDSIVHYGTTPSLGHSRAIEESVVLHHVEIPLEPGAVAYYYRVQTGASSSPVASFKAYPKDELRVAVIADLQGKPDLSAVARDNVHLLMTAGIISRISGKEVTAGRTAPSRTASSSMPIRRCSGRRSSCLCSAIMIRRSDPGAVPLRRNPCTM